MIPFDTSNKTKLNKKKANPKERYDLTAGDEIFFGKDGPYRVVDLNGVIKPSIIDTGVERQVERPGMERQMKKATDEKISLTSPDAKFWMDLKIRERLNEESILNKHANRIKETDSKKARLEFLNNRRLQLEDTINSMKIKGEEIDNERKKITEERNRLEQESTQGKETYMKVDEIHLDEHLSKGTRRICS